MGRKGAGWRGTQGIISTPYWGWYNPLLTLTHSPNCAASIGDVYCFSGVFVHSVDFRH